MRAQLLLVITFGAGLGACAVPTDPTAEDTGAAEDELVTALPRGTYRLASGPTGDAEHDAAFVTRLTVLPNARFEAELVRESVVTRTNPFYPFTPTMRVERNASFAQGKVRYAGSAPRLVDLEGVGTFEVRRSGDVVDLFATRGERRHTTLLRDASAVNVSAEPPARFRCTKLGLAFQGTIELTLERDRGVAVVDRAAWDFPEAGTYPLGPDPAFAGAGERGFVGNKGPRSLRFAVPLADLGTRSTFPMTVNARHASTDPSPFVVDYAITLQCVRRLP